jgi:hypothetical protein
MTDQPLWEILDYAYDRGFVAIDDDDRARSAGFAHMLLILADIVEDRGMKGLDLDPGETADWLRAEADRAEKGDV